jgi:hypothetical protein
LTRQREITDSALQSRVRARYCGEIAALQALGFHHPTFKVETLGPFSAVVQFRLARLMRRFGEVLVSPFPLRLGVANVLLFHAEPPSIVSCSGMGVKFYTDFSDDSLLISSTLQIEATFQRLTAPNPYSKIIRNPPCPTPEEAWLSHKRRAAEIEAQGKTIRNTSSFADCVKILKREEIDVLSTL